MFRAILEPCVLRLPTNLSVWMKSTHDLISAIDGLEGDVGWISSIFGGPWEMKFPASVRFVEISTGSRVLEINHPAAKGRIAYHGAQVLEWQPTGQEPVIYLSPAAVFREGKAIRGGIPICWPWFNAHPSDPEKPSHGFARTRFWNLESVRENDGFVTVRFSMNEGPWAAFLTIKMGKELDISLESKNLGDEPIPISGALHSYLKVGDIDRVRIDHLNGAEYLDTVGTPTKRTQQGAVVIEGEVDRIYASRERLEVVDESMRRTIVIRKEGSPSTVVWNPWIEKAAALDDLPDDGYKDFICVETAIANDLAVNLEPQASIILRTILSVLE